MKKIDKLVLGAFLGPFFLTFLVVVFILLTQHMLKYFDDIIGKGLGGEVIGQLLFYFAIFMTPVALPLAVLLSSLIAFGNLGEHFELTAIKSAGVSLVRTLRPIFFFVIILTVLAFFVNNNLVPKAALEAYSLLYDIKQKKPALDLREGAFYNGINDISIKVNKKFPDGITLKDVIVYDHRKNDGNKVVIVADSGKMYTILNERYLKFELFRGYNYEEGATSDREISGPKRKNNESLRRSKFSKTQVIFDLSSFKLERTDKKWFQGNRMMRNLTELDGDIDSVKGEVMRQNLNFYQYKPNYFTYYLKYDSIVMPLEIYKYKLYTDSIKSIPYKDRGQISMSSNNRSSSSQVKSESPTTSTLDTSKAKNEKLVVKPVIRKPLLKKRMPKKNIKKIKRHSLIPTLLSAKKPNVKPPPAKHKKKVNSDSTIQAKIDSVFFISANHEMLQGAANMARQVKSQIQNANTSIYNYNQELRTFEIQWHKIFASSMACIAMFLIGAPLGAIIKKGGLGVPFLVSIFFFIVYYILTMQGDKLAKNETVSVAVGVWAADTILLVVGLFFLRQARIDARLFEADFYRVVIDKVKRRFKARRTLKDSVA